MGRSIIMRFGGTGNMPCRGRHERRTCVGDKGAGRSGVGARGSMRVSMKQMRNEPSLEHVPA